MQVWPIFSDAPVEVGEFLTLEEAQQQAQQGESQQAGEQAQQAADEMEDAAREMAKGLANSPTVASPLARRARIARRVPSARAPNVASRLVTIWLPV